MKTKPALQPPCFALFVDDDSDVYVDAIVGSMAIVHNENGDAWHEPVANLYLAPEGWSW